MPGCIVRKRRWRSCLKRVELDLGIKKACNRLLASGWRLVIASAGCAWYIEKLLAPLNIEAEIHANPGHFSEQEGLIMELPLASPYSQPGNRYR